ncbi:hypothetical protein [Sulfurisphaera ohwakuensis]|uniref:Uncharacterized protein n=1 Tax=Sulfurisphaera ohwakuensis TaxID=69656 RepID=A0A650CFU2_SULOH|nr:hypothetical protein [Sulfurisphaera ohwakuensis]MBB5255139.1 hypothetical protein [Sulfurisphaera ohwakuensis]QGR16608.1 hypothetical protein D1869_04920 [Sulfurisphaera ohwakuensis]
MITTVVRSEETEIDIKKAIKTSLLMTFFLVAIPINSIMLTQAILAYVGYYIYSNYGPAAAFGYATFLQVSGITDALSTGIQDYGPEFFSQLLAGLGYGLMSFYISGDPVSLL